MQSNLHSVNTSRFPSHAVIIISLIAALVSCTDGRYPVSNYGDDNIESALAKIRYDRETGKSCGPVRIILKKGVYRIQGPIVFGPADTCITVTGAGTGKTIISGGETIPTFVEEDGLWVSDLSGTAAGGRDFQQLYVNGERATLARTPDYGKFFITGSIEETPIESEPGCATGHTQSVLDKAKLSAEMLKALENVSVGSETARVSFLHKWDVTRRIISAVIPEDSLLIFKGAPKVPWNKMDECSQCYFDNDKSFLDAPGEWFYDKEHQKLYYFPRDGEDIASTEATVPVTDKLIVVEGRSDGRIHDVTFADISFRYSGYVMDKKGENPEQAAASSEASVMVEAADRIRFENCEIAHTGNNGIWFRNSCRNSLVEGCYIHDLGIGGVKIGTQDVFGDEDTELTRHITINNNIIRNGSRVRETGVGVTLFMASDCRITHNDISDFNYSGMSIGWVWGYSYSPSKRNTVSYNHIHHIGWGALSDMGGIYTLGISEGTEICHNRIHDIYSYGYGGWGLYTDEGSTGIRMECNLVYNCKSSSFHQHYGENNVIANNIFVNGIKAQMEATLPEDHLSFTFCNNLICHTTGEMYGIQWDKVNFDSHDNLYWRYGGSVSFNGLTLEEWQEATGKDFGSMIADPGFKDIGSGDFTITNRENVEAVGFKPFDWTEAGVYGDRSWRELAETDPATDAAFKACVNHYLSLTI